MSDVQLLLATAEDSKTSISKEELEKVHSQVSVGSHRKRGPSGKQSEASPDLEMWARKSLGNGRQGVGCVHFCSVEPMVSFWRA